MPPPLPANPPAPPVLPLALLAAPSAPAPPAPPVPPVSTHSAVVATAGIPSIASLVASNDAIAQSKRTEIENASTGPARISRTAIGTAAVLDRDAGNAGVAVAGNIKHATGVITANCEIRRPRADDGQV